VAVSILFSQLETDQDMTNSMQFDLSLNTPPANSSPPLQALWWLKKGELRLGAEWDKAHTICQGEEGEPIHDWIHALCHLIEGDHGNAAYWFRRAGKSGQHSEPQKVWDEIAASLT